MKYKASCHCGKIAFEANGTIDSALSCNCSICSRKGSLLWFVQKNDFKLLTDDAAANTYTFNKHAIKHRFCPICGVSPYAEAVNPAGVAMAAINLRCVEDLDLTTIPVHHFDGKSL